MTKIDELLDRLSNIAGDDSKIHEFKYLFGEIEILFEELNNYEKCRIASIIMVMMSDDLKSVSDNICKNMLLSHKNICSEISEKYFYQFDYKDIGFLVKYGDKEFEVLERGHTGNVSDGLNYYDYNLCEPLMKSNNPDFII